MKISKRMVLSSIVCVLPLVVSALLYRQLPNQMPIHWNSVGDTTITKGQAVINSPVSAAFIPNVR